MKALRDVGCVLVLMLVAGKPTATWAQPAETEQPAADNGESAPLFRIFLKDGQSLVSYGEFARVGDLVVFSMPTTTVDISAQLQLINVAADRVDWDKTNGYTESLRANRYLRTRAETDYAALTADVALTLERVASTESVADRLVLVERARRALAEWPATHFNYKRDDVLQMLGILDEVIADLRAASGASSFDFSLVASSVAAETPVTLLPPPTLQEAIQGTLIAASVTTNSVERMSLLTVALNTIESAPAEVPPEWLARARSETVVQIETETAIDRRYHSLSGRLLGAATARAKMADVRGVQRVLKQIDYYDAALGSRRPDMVAALVADVEAQLDAARRLRLARDRWALRAPALRAYRAAIALTLERFRRMAPVLEDIKALAGSGPSGLGAVLSVTQRIQRTLTIVKVPSELADVHNMFVSASQLASNAALIRREAAINNSMNRAWDASSAAAGALMLVTRGRADLTKALKPPQYVR